MIKFVHMDLDTIGDIDEFLGPFWRRGEIAGDRENGFDVILTEATIVKASAMMGVKIGLGGLEIRVDATTFERMELT
jgi:hypothetical protein